MFHFIQINFFYQTKNVKRSFRNGQIEKMGREPAKVFPECRHSLDYTLWRFVAVATSVVVVGKSVLRLMSSQLRHFFYSLQRFRRNHPIFISSSPSSDFVSFCFSCSLSILSTTRHVGNIRKWRVKRRREYERDRIVGKASDTFVNTAGGSAL